MEELKLRKSLLGMTHDSALEFDCSETAVDGAIMDSGHEPDGYFWDSVVTYLCQQEDPDLITQFTTEPETDRWSAFCDDDAVLSRVENLLLPYLDDPDALSELIKQAEGEGFCIED